VGDAPAGNAGAKNGKKLLARLADAEQAAIFNDNAARVYRLG